MAVDVKPLGESAEIWSQRSGAASQRYADRAVAAASRWLSSTVAAAGNYFTAVSSAGVQDRFRRGVQGKGQARYGPRIASLGQQRYSSGVAGAQQDWQDGFAPFAQTIAALTLPARRPRGDVANYTRVQAVGTALNARRLALLGSGG